MERIMITTYLRDLCSINLIYEIQIHNIYQKKNSQKKKTHTHNESIDANSMTNKPENQHKKLQRPISILIFFITIIKNGFQVIFFITITIITLMSVYYLIGA